jgi:hypothetical protein
MWNRGASDQSLTRRQKFVMFDIRCNPAWIRDSLREADAAYLTTRELRANADEGWPTPDAARSAPQDLPDDHDLWATHDVSGYAAARLG